MLKEQAVEANASVHKALLRILTNLQANHRGARDALSSATRVVVLRLELFWAADSGARVLDSATLIFTESLILAQDERWRRA